MSMATGFLLMGVLAVIGSVGLLGLAIWIRNRDDKTERPDDGIKHV